MDTRKLQTQKTQIKAVANYLLEMLEHTNNVGDVGLQEAMLRAAVHEAYDTLRDILSK